MARHISRLVRRPSRWCTCGVASCTDQCNQVCRCCNALYYRGPAGGAPVGGQGGSSGSTCGFASCYMLPLAGRCTTAARTGGRCTQTSPQRVQARFCAWQPHQCAIGTSSGRLSAACQNIQREAFCAGNEGHSDQSAGPSGAAEGQGECHDACSNRRVDEREDRRAGGGGGSVLDHNSRHGASAGHAMHSSVCGDADCRITATSCRQATPTVWHQMQSRPASRGSRGSERRQGGSGGG